MAKNTNPPWTREESIIAFALYCRIPLSKTSKNHPEIIRVAKIVGRTPSSVQLKVGNFGSVDPELKKRGISGLSHAAKMVSELWREFEGNWDKLAWEAHILEQSMSGRVNVHPEENKLPEGAERERVVRQRINQDFFRHAVLSVYDKRCCITGIDIPEVLIASHIKPWAQCEPAEQTNPSNGLCLNTLHDCAFDRGLITVTDDLCVQTSSMLEKSRNDTVREWLVGFNGHRIEKPEKFLPSRDFLAWHRTHVFRE